MGIGTPSPATKLDVDGDIRSSTVATNCVGNCPSSVTPPASGNWLVAGDLTVSGDLTADNFYDQAPSGSTALKVAVYNSTHTTWGAAGRIASTTVTVPAGETRKYRISAKTMAYPTDGNGYIYTRIHCSN